MKEGAWDTRRDQDLYRKQVLENSLTKSKLSNTGIVGNRGEVLNLGTLGERADEGV